MKKMSDKEFAERLQRIADLAKKQREGRYTLESDSAEALDLIETLAKLLIEHFLNVRL